MRLSTLTALLAACSGGEIRLPGKTIADVRVTPVVVDDEGGAVAECPDGAEALSGGCACDGAVEVSKPIDGGWLCGCAGDASAEATALCFSQAR